MSGRTLPRESLARNDLEKLASSAGRPYNFAFESSYVDSRLLVVFGQTAEFKKFHDRNVLPLKK